MRDAIRQGLFRALAALERLVPDINQPRYSPTFLIGPPRGGTTLVRQLMAWGLATCHFTNLLAEAERRLGYPAPFAAALVVRWLHGRTPTDRHYRAGPFHSVHGQTRGRTAPAEGELIWGCWFGTREGPVEPRQVPSEQARAMRRAVAVTELVFGSPFVNKTTALSLRIRALAEAFPTALFVQVHRDPLDTAQSILRARLTEYPDWLGARPRECEDVSGKSVERQVCDQVFYIERSIARERNAVGEERFLSVSYRDACEHPDRELERIRGFMAGHGAPTRRIRAVPASFPFSHGCKVDQEQYRRMQAYLEELAGGG